MPPLKPVMGVAKCIVLGEMSGVACVNIFHWAKGSRTPFTQTELNTLASQLRAQYVSRFMEHIHPDYVLGSVEAIDLSTDEGLSGIASGSTPGTAAGAHMPANAAVCVTWKIGRRYRGGHPRNYLPPPGDVAITASQNSWDADYVTQVEASASNFRSSMNQVGATAGSLCCVHRYRTFTEGQVTELDPPQVSLFIGQTVDNRIDSQRRRLGPDR